MYVVLLGLDVIGNPFGLAVGVARSVEDFFYEPFQVWAGHNPFGLAVGVARSVEDFFYEPFQVLRLAIIPSAWVLGTGLLYLVLRFLLRTLPGVGLGAALRTSSTNQVLGLAIAHNPFGLAVGVARSVEDFFYEPFQVLGLAIIHSAWLWGWRAALRTSSTNLSSY
jgi:hypothetical protein